MARMVRDLCPVCASADLVACIDRDPVPVFQNALYPTEAKAKAAATGRLAIRFCRACGFGFNAAFEPELVAYGADYENDQTVSRVFSAHVDNMAGKVLSALDGRAKPIVLEVGCGQGYFLERLVKLAPRPLGSALGFDPSFRGEANPPLRIQARYFDRAAADEIQAAIDAIASRHVIEHIIEPVAFLRAVRAALPDDARVELFLETPCVEWILTGSVVQDFFYEHCSYFTTESLGLCLRLAGFGVEAVEHVFTGQYLWAKAHPDGAASTALPTALPQLAMAARFADRSSAVATRWQRDIADIVRGGGKVALWGAAAKGVTFASIVDPKREIIDCLVDVNPKKQGNFAPITAHPILAAEEAVRRGVTTAIIMNPNYRAEIVAMVRDQALPFALLDG
jgi:hypothetical protein